MAVLVENKGFIGDSKSKDGWKWVIDPRTCNWLPYWDLVTTVCLLFTSTVTPVEVAFITPPEDHQKWTNPLFLTNRVVDSMFILDMIFQFRIAFRMPGIDLRWITEPRLIAINYVCSKWFWIDLFSVLTLFFDVVGGEGTKDLTVLRAIRVLRLAKLIRLARGSRIFKAWEMQLSINYAYLELFSVTVTIVFACHLFACIWGLQATFYPLQSWLAAKEYCVPWGHEDEAVARGMLSLPTHKVEEGACPDKYTCALGDCDGGVCSNGYACIDAFHMYTYSLYFSVMTITSVGYGDIVATAFNPTEQILCTLIMLLSGMLWGYLVGTFCGLAAGLSPMIKMFREDLSAMNHFMAAHGLPSQTRFRMREYVHQTLPLRQIAVERQLLDNLSPAMQAEVSYKINSLWIEHVWYLNHLHLSNAAEHPGLRIELASRLSPFIFPPGEFCPTGFMYIIQRGSALWAGKMLRADADSMGRKSVWGDDVVLETAPTLQLEFPALAATYLHVFTIEGKTINDVIRKFPEVVPHIARTCQRWIMRRALVREAERRSFEHGSAFRGRLRPIYAKELIRPDSTAHDMRASLAGSFSKGGLNLRESAFFGRKEHRASCTSLMRQPTRMCRSSVRKSAAASGISGTSILEQQMTTSKSPKKKNRPSVLSAPVASAGAPSATKKEDRWSKTKKDDSGREEVDEKKRAEKMREADVARAATSFGLDEMKLNMKAHIAKGGAEPERIARLEDKVDAMAADLKKIVSALAAIRSDAAVAADDCGPRWADQSRCGKYSEHDGSEEMRESQAPAAQPFWA
jgi:hypothetical protein